MESNTPLPTSSPQVDDEIEIPEEKEKLSQAGRILWKFGGALRLWEAFKAAGFERSFTSIYRWNYPRERGGSDGRIPSCVWPDLFVVARANGIVITPEDIDPREKFMGSIALKAFPQKIVRKRRIE